MVKLYEVKKKFCWTNLVLHNLVKQFPMQMVPMMITKEYWALILTMLHLDSTGFQTVGSSSQYHLSSCSRTKLNLYRKNRKKNQIKLDQAKTENSNILLYVQPHPQGILPFRYWKMRSFNCRSL